MSSLQTVALISLYLYVTVPLYMIIQGWFVRAAIAMLLIAQMPVIWQAHCSDSDTPGFALLAIFLSAPALPLLVFGVGALIVRRLRSGRP